MIPQEKWKWYGDAAHFICADRCLFHLSTRIGKYIVSTVGDYRPNGAEKPQETIGAGKDSFYETYVFEADKNHECGCPNIKPSEIDGERWADHTDANKGHLKYCRKYAKRS